MERETMLKPSYETIDAVPEGLREHYTEKSGKYVLAVDGTPEGFVPASQIADLNKKLGEFRTTNVSRGKEIDALKAKLEGTVSSEEYTGVKKKLDELQAAAGGGSGGGTPPAPDFKKELEKALAPMRESLSTMQAKNESSEKARIEAERKVERKELEGRLQTAGIQAGVDEKALSDYLRRGLDQWEMVEGEAVAKDGDTPIISNKTGNPITMDEWVGGLVDDAPHLFKPSRGGGAAGNDRGGPPPPKKTISTEDPLEFGRNAEGIAKGEVRVQQPG